MNLNISLQKKLCMEMFIIGLHRTKWYNFGEYHTNRKVRKNYQKMRTDLKFRWHVHVSVNISVYMVYLFPLSGQICFWNMHEKNKVLSGDIWPSGGVALSECSCSLFFPFQQIQWYILSATGAHSCNFIWQLFRRMCQG